MKKDNRMDQFIGTFPNAISDDLCARFVNYFDSMSEQGLTMATALGMHGATKDFKDDEQLIIPKGLPLGSDFPEGLTYPLWEKINRCYNIYYDKYSINRYLTSNTFKIHRVIPTGGYHEWHYEQDFYNQARLLAWHITIESPKRGGETEFLFQSMRIEPEVGKLVIWPAGFTHKHRGNPPLEGQKTYLTGWFEISAQLP